MNIFICIDIYLVIIKSESVLDGTDFVIEKIDSNFLKDISSIKTEISMN
jgi:hypothetical protein